MKAISEILEGAIVNTSNVKGDTFVTVEIHLDHFSSPEGIPRLAKLLTSIAELGFRSYDMSHELGYYDEVEDMTMNFSAFVKDLNL